MSRGEKANMVMVVKDFKIVRDHAEMLRTLPFFHVYYVVKGEGKNAEVRIVAGQIGYDGPLTEEIKTWLEKIGAVDVADVVPDEFFLGSALK